MGEGNSVLTTEKRRNTEMKPLLTARPKGRRRREETLASVCFAEEMNESRDLDSYKIGFLNGPLRAAGANQILKVCQSQRDCVPKPRVARNELPWGNGSERQNPNGVSASVKVNSRSQPRWGCCFARLLPKVARSSQPWVLLRNPVGIQGKGTLPKPDLRTPKRGKEIWSGFLPLRMAG